MNVPKPPELARWSALRWTALLGLLVVALAGCAMLFPSRGDHPPLETAAPVDLDRYLGEWYVIANIPYFAERGNVEARAVYRKRDDGRMDDLYFYRDDFDSPEETMDGVAWVVEGSGNARWKVRFFWPMTFDYVIVDLVENCDGEGEGEGEYTHVAVGHPSREYGWVMARTPRIDPGEYERLMQVFERNGYDRSRFMKVPQFPEQVGQPGFQ